jgi:Fe2+ transport system protein FeoA
MLLDSAPQGTPLRIIEVGKSGHFPHRLMELGLIEGKEIKVLRRAPLGDPMHLRLGDYELSLRSSDAALIDVSPL